jgi:hypothetical protein
MNHLSMTVGISCILGARQRERSQGHIEIASSLVSVDVVSLAYCTGGGIETHLVQS